MNKIKNSICIASAVAMLGFTGCNKFGDLNQNPNAPTTPLTSAMLTNIESQLGNVSADKQATSFYIQYFSQLQYPDYQLYSLTNIGWDDLYTGPLEDLQNIINVNTAKPDILAIGGNSKNQIQIARILKAYYFMSLTDRYGDIPYSQALKGIPSTAYDKQQDIYNDLFKELKESNQGFASDGNPIKGDIIFSGNISQWKKLANSIRMILAMNLSKVDPVKGKTEFMLALNDPDGYISSNSDNFILNYPGGNFNNPFSNLTGAATIAISKTIADKMNSYNDPRVYAFGQANSNGIVKGVPYGLNRSDIQNWLSNNTDWSAAFATNMKRPNSSLVIISASYMDLLRAEAAITYGTGEDSYSLVTKGLKDSWNQWGVAGDVPTYLTNQGISSSSNVTLGFVAEQIWISSYGNSMLAWNEWRRTGYPNLSVAPDASLKSIPRRFGYPPTEPTLNADAYNAAVKALPYGGGDNTSSRIWWDKP